MYCGALAALGPDVASTTVPALLDALDDPKLATYAATALSKIAPDAPKVRKAFARIVKRESPGCVTAARTLAATAPTLKLANLLLRHLDDSGRMGLEAANALTLFPASQLRLTPEIRSRATEPDDSWACLTAAIAAHRAENDVDTTITALTWSWDANLSIRAEVARYLPNLGPVGLAAFASRLEAELADPTRHRFRQFTNGGGSSDVVDDEELLTLCRSVIGGEGSHGEHH